MPACRLKQCLPIGCRYDHTWLLTCELEGQGRHLAQKSLCVTYGTCGEAHLHDLRRGATGLRPERQTWRSQMPK